MTKAEQITDPVAVLSASNCFAGGVTMWAVTVPTAVSRCEPTPQLSSVHVLPLS
jgi:hypothetical protein